MTAPTPPEPQRSSLEPLIVELTSAVKDLSSSMRSNAEGAGGGAERTVSDELESLSKKINKFGESLVGAAGMGIIQSRAKDLGDQMKALQAEVASGAKSEKEAKEELKRLSQGFKDAKSDVAGVNETLAQLKDRLGELSNNITKSLSDRIFDKLGGSIEGGGILYKNLFDKFGAVFTGVMNFVGNGIKNASELAITAQEGVALEFSNQLTVIKSAFSNLGDPNKIIDKAQLESVEKNITESLGGISKGLELDPDAVENMVGQFREGLNSQITPTAETFRSLAQMGIDPTTQGLTQLREASGRAGLGLREMGVLAKNATAIQIFGQGIVKTTLDLDRMGISIQSVMRQSESYVTNLDGAIDSIAQLNQLGVQLDFGELTQLQEFDPAAAIQYVADRISPEQLQSTSFRALLSSVPGVNMEEILKLKGMKGMEELESSTTKQAKEAGTLAKALTSVSMIAGAVSTTFMSLIGTVGGAIASLLQFRASLLELRAITSTLRTAAVPGGGPVPVNPNLGGPGTGGTPTTGPTYGAPPPPPATVGGQMKAGATGGLGTGIGLGVMSGVTAAMSGGSWKKVIVSAVAPILGSVVGGALGAAMVAGLAATGVGLPIATAIGPGLISAMTILGGSLAGIAANKFMDDGISMPGYGDRKLVTPAGTYALNNNDTVMAGTNLLSKGSLQAGGGRDSSALMAKIDRLISVLESAETTVVVNNTSQRVKRATLVGVRTRDEAEA